MTFFYFWSFRETFSELAPEFLLFCHLFIFSENEKTSSAFRGLFYVTESQVIFLFFSIFYEKLGRL